MQLIPNGKNQNILLVPRKKIFFSYQVPVAAEINGKLYYTNKKHSTTTSKHISNFLDAYIDKAIPKDQSFFDNLLS